MRTMADVEAEILAEVKADTRALRDVIDRMSNGCAFPKSAVFSSVASWMAVLEELADLRREIRELKRGAR